MSMRPAKGKRWTERFLTMEQAREALPELAQQFAADQRLGAIIVTDKGQPALAVMTAERYEGFAATLDILGDQEILTLLHEILGEGLGRGKVVWDETKEPPER
jgi:PHD/YefM family antitoxin component YafN of YafNO toxin-antitoxin module